MEKTKKACFHDSHFVCVWVRAGCMLVMVCVVRSVGVLIRFEWMSRDVGRGELGWGCVGFEVSVGG